VFHYGSVCNRCDDCYFEVDNKFSLWLSSEEGEGREKNCMKKNAELGL